MLVLYTHFTSAFKFEFNFRSNYSDSNSNSLRANQHHLIAAKRARAKAEQLHQLKTSYSLERRLFW
jgi:hypothetical protein